MQIKYGLFSKKIFYSLLHLIYYIFVSSGCLYSSKYQEQQQPGRDPDGHNTTRTQHKQTDRQTERQHSSTQQRIKDTQHLHHPRAYMHRLRRGRRDVCGRSEARGFRRDWGRKID